MRNATVQILKRRKTRSVFLLTVFLAILVSSCTFSRKNNGIRTVTDMGNRTMQVPDSIRRVYVDHHGGFLLYAIDPEITINQAIKVSETSRPYMLEKYAQLPYIDGSVEEIVKMKPDIIIACNKIDETSIDNANKLAEKTSIPVFLVDMNMLNYRKTFALLGDLLNRKEQTGRMDEFVHHYLDTIAVRGLRIPDSQKVRVYYAEGDCGLATDPSGSKHSQILDFVGAKNVAEVGAVAGKGMSQVSMEQILLWDPDQVLCWTVKGKEQGTYQCILQDKAWKTTRAVKAGQVHQIPFLPYGWFDRPPGTNRILGTIWTAHQLYPEIFPYDMEAVTREYFNLFYHHELTEEQLIEVLYPDPTKMPSIENSDKTKMKKP